MPRVNQMVAATIAAALALPAVADSSDTEARDPIFGAVGDKGAEKVERQQERQQNRVNQRVDHETDEALDKAVGDALDSLFD